MDKQSEYKYDFFIAYAKSDHEWVHGYLLDALDKANLRYHSLETLELGRMRELEIEDAIEQSQRILLIITPAYLVDDTLTFVELLGRRHGVESNTWPIIPIILKPTKLPTRLAAFVCLDISEQEDWETGIARLIDISYLPTLPASPHLTPPYPGLRAFRENDGDLFYGRDAEIDHVLGRLRKHPFLTIIGPSGSGKSSLIFAGLVPKLRQSNILGFGKWRILELRPGDVPLQNLTDTVDKVLLDDHRKADNGSSSDQNYQRLLLIIDQFEELFTGIQKDIIPFQKRLLHLSKLPNVSVILTVRADFYADLMTSVIWPEIQKHRYELLPLDKLGLAQAISKPAQRAGVFIEPLLVERLVADAGGEPGILPLVQETMILLWDKLQRRYLPLSAYEGLVLPGQKTAGLQAAIALHANAVLNNLNVNEEQQAIARRIFIRLVHFGNGRAHTRRQQPLSSLRAAEDPALFDLTISHLSDEKNRLLTLTSNEGSPEPKVDISHESLIAAWPTLQEWLHESHEAEEIRRRLEVKAKEWVRLGKQSGGLLDTIELTEVEAWLSHPDAKILGHSTNLKELVAISKHAVNPGWHRKGTIVLGGLSIGIAALLSWLYLRTSEISSNVIRITIWLAVISIAGLSISISGMLRRDRPYRGQHISHFVAQRSFIHAITVLLLVGNIVLWGIFGIQEIQTTAYCSHLGYERPRENQIHVALMNNNPDPYYATQLFQETLGGYLQIQVKDVSSPNDELCAPFFTHILTLARSESTNEEISYTATITDTKSRDVQEFSVVGTDFCGETVDLAYEIADDMGIDTGVEAGLNIHTVKLCEAYLLNQTGYSDYKEGNYIDAEINLLQAIKLEPTFAIAYHNLGLVYLQQEDKYVNAVTALKSANDLLPDYSMFLTDVGVACYRVEDYICGENYYLEAIEVDPSYLRAYNNLAVLYRAWGRYDDAEERLYRAISLAENMEVSDHWEPALYKNLGITQYHQGAWIDAISSLEKAGEHDSDFEEEIVYYLALSYEEGGDTNESCRQWQRYQLIAPSNLFRESWRRADAKQRSINCEL